MIKIKLAKFFHGLDEKLITATDVLEESALKVWQFNEGKNQEVGCLYLSLEIIPAKNVDSEECHVSAISCSIKSLVY